MSGSQDHLRDAEEGVNLPLLPGCVSPMDLTGLSEKDMWQRFETTRESTISQMEEYLLRRQNQPAPPPDSGR